MAKRQHADPNPPPTRRQKAAEARRKARLKRNAREKWIIDKLNRGMSVVELTARQGVTLRRMQILVREILARRAPSPPAEYLALQVNRLNEADDRRLRVDGRRQPQGGRPGGQDRQRDGSLSRLLSEARESAGQSAPARPAGSGAARPRAAARSGARWKSRCNRLKRLISAMEIDRAARRPHPKPSPAKGVRKNARLSTGYAGEGRAPFSRPREKVARRAG